MVFFREHQTIRTKSLYFVVIMIFFLFAPMVLSTQETITAGEHSFEKLLQEAEKGDVESQHTVAQIYYTSEPKDLKNAIKWFRKAANAGHPWAQFRMGGFYLEGEGVPKDNKEALKWFTKAAEQEFSMAQVELGFLYYNGQIVPKDYVEAYKWFNLAAANVPPDWWYSDPAGIRDKLEQLMSPSQIAEAQRLSREFKPVKKDRKTK